MSFRRERFRPKGGPDGGDGGRGGCVRLRADASLNTLIDFRYQQHFRAQRGGHGMGKNRAGRAGEDLLLRVPVGTQVFAEDGVTLLCDLATEGAEFVAARGGRGGRGNARFKSPTQRTPRRADPGEPGEKRWIWLKLKLLADVGLIGLPNAGKSTLLGAISRARPEVAPYPFTTLYPKLGTVELGELRLVVADLPGLIAGAHQGAGLGHRFLAHIERCALLLHLVDASTGDAVESYRTVRRELALYRREVAAKPELVALTKCDLLEPGEVAERCASLERAVGARVYPISARTGAGVAALLAAVKEALADGKTAALGV